MSKTAHIHEVIADLRLVLTETCITSDAADAIKLDFAPPGYQVTHQARCLSADRRGRGIAFICREDAKVRSFDLGSPSEFQLLAVSLSLQPLKHIVITCVYRPPGAVTHHFCKQLADDFDQWPLLCGLW